MNIQEIILNKRNGEEMSEAEISFLVQGISNGSIPDYQISAWAMAVYFRGMTESETNAFTLAMANSGEVMDLSEIAGIKVDKHSSGGVGDKTTLVIIPLAAAAGVTVAKMSGRGLGHTGGTIDKFESIPGFQVERTNRQFIDQVNRIKAAVVAQTGNLVPADKKLYSIRDVTATVDSIPLIASSIMSKKIASGAQGIVLDVKVGNGAFMNNEADAVQLAQTMVNIGKGAGRKVVALLTDMSQPLGVAIGNALEVKEAIDLLRGKGERDLRSLCIELTAHMLMLAELASHLEEARQKVTAVLDSGAGFTKFCEIVETQEGRLDYELPSYGLPIADLQFPVTATQEGFIESIDALKIGHIAMLLGAGRAQIGDAIDPAVGIQVFKKKGDYIKKGDILFMVHVNNNDLVPMAQQGLDQCYKISSIKPKLQPLILDTIR